MTDVVCYADIILSLRYRITKVSDNIFILGICDRCILLC